MAEPKWRRLGISARTEELARASMATQCAAWLAHRPGRELRVREVEGWWVVEGRESAEVTA
jgi:hypothetical protein